MKYAIALMIKYILLNFGVYVWHACMCASSQVGADVLVCVYSACVCLCVFVCEHTRAHMYGGPRLTLGSYFNGSMVFHLIHGSIVSQLNSELASMACLAK